MKSSLSVRVNPSVHSTQAGTKPRHQTWRKIIAHCLIDSDEKNVAAVICITLEHRGLCFINQIEVCGFVEKLSDGRLLFRSVSVCCCGEEDRFRSHRKDLFAGAVSNEIAKLEWGLLSLKSNCTRLLAKS